jgi:hypothetical protein
MQSGFMQTQACDIQNQSKILQGDILYKISTELVNKYGNSS